MPGARASLWDRLRSRWRHWFSTGPRGERLAADFLRSQGYTILARNLRCPVGEIDLLAQAPDGRTLVVVEVKSSGGFHDGLPPELHVNQAKRRKLSVLAMHLARQDAYRDRPIRFDVIGVLLTRGSSERATIRHHPGAFESLL